MLCHSASAVHCFSTSPATYTPCCSLAACTCSDKVREQVCGPSDGSCQLQVRDGSLMSLLQLRAVEVGIPKDPTGRHGGARCVMPPGLNPPLPSLLATGLVAVHALLESLVWAAVAKHPSAVQVGPRPQLGSSALFVAPACSHAQPICSSSRHLRSSWQSAPRGADQNHYSLGHPHAAGLTCCPSGSTCPPGTCVNFKTDNNNWCEGSMACNALEGAWRSLHAANAAALLPLKCSALPCPVMPAAALADKPASRETRPASTGVATACQVSRNGCCHGRALPKCSTVGRLHRKLQRNAMKPPHSRPASRFHFRRRLMAACPTCPACRQVQVPHRCGQQVPSKVYLL